MKQPQLTLKTQTSTAYYIFIFKNTNSIMPYILPSFHNLLGLQNSVMIMKFKAWILSRMSCLFP